MVIQGTQAILIISNTLLIHVETLHMQPAFSRREEGQKGLKSFIVPFLTQTVLTSKELSAAGSL